MERHFYSARDMSCYLCVTEAAVRKWAVRERIPFVKLGKCLIDMIRINGWLKEQECAYVKREFPQS